MTKPLNALLTEQVNPASREIDRLSTGDMLRVINDEDRLVADAVAAAIPLIAEAVDGIVRVFESGGHLFYIGAGTSGRLGVLDASECPPTYGVPAEMVRGIMAGGETALAHATEASEDVPETGVQDLRSEGFTGKDALVGIAASGRTPYVLGAVKYANDLGAFTAGISCTPDSELSRAVKCPIEVLVGPEIVAGSTRMKAGTATKLVLNMISTGAMIRLGYVFGNLMVNVQPKNEKLVDRATRIISTAACVSYEEAAELLKSAGDVRTAIVMHRKGVNRDEASQLLARAKGRIRVALEL